MSLTNVIYEYLIEAQQEAEEAFYKLVRADLTIKQSKIGSITKLSGVIDPREGLMPFSVELLIVVTGQVC